MVARDARAEQARKWVHFIRRTQNRWRRPFRHASRGPQRRQPGKLVFHFSVSSSSRSLRSLC
jgi:hypothetical protein